MKAFFAATFVFLAFAPLLHAEKYEIDAAHASIYFKTTHLDVSEIYGRFNEFSGDVTWTGDAEDADFGVEIQTASVDTGVKKRDNHLRSPDFFNAAQHPTITFASTGVEAKGDDVFHVTGDFMMNGRTKQITIPMTYHGQTEFRGTEKIGFSGELAIDRRAWGLDAWKGLVGNDITLMVSFEADKQ